MDEKSTKYEKTTAGAENGGSNDPKVDEAERTNAYIEERKNEKKQIESFRVICKTIVAILFIVSLIFGVYCLSLETVIGVGIIVVSVLLVALFERLIDVVCNLFVDVKAIRVLLWEQKHK